MKKYAALAAVAAALVLFSATTGSEPEPTTGHQQGPSLSSEVVVGHVIGPSVAELAESGDLP